MNVKKSDRLYKSDRLSYIANRMRVCQDITPTMLAEELHISERTVYRDLRNLEKGNSLQKRYSRREGRYLLEGELNLPPLTLTPSEALALFTSASNPALAHDNFFAADLRSGLKKVAHLLTSGSQATGAQAQTSAAGAENDGQPENEARAEDHRSANSQSPADSPAADTQEAPIHLGLTSHSIQRPLLETIRRAMRSNRKLHLMYWSPATDSEKTLLVSPYHLREVSQHWYLLANSEEHGAIRTFKISRVRKAEMAEDRFRFPRGFSADTFFERAWQANGSHDDAINVVARFAPSVANLVHGSRGHQFSEMVYESDGSLVCTVAVNSLKEISWWILSYGSRAEVLSPPELRAQFAQVAQELTSRYAQPPAPIVPQENSTGLDVSSTLSASEELPTQAVVRAIETKPLHRV